MDNTTKLIRWQRIMIEVLLIAIPTLGCAYIREQNLTFMLSEDKEGTDIKSTNQAN